MKAHPSYSCRNLGGSLNRDLGEEILKTQKGSEGEGVGKNRAPNSPIDRAKKKGKIRAKNKAKNSPIFWGFCLRFLFWGFCFPWIF
jgi:hypothetical protein